MASFCLWSVRVGRGHGCQFTASVVRSPFKQPRPANHPLQGGVSGKKASCLHSLTMTPMARPPCQVSLLLCAGSLLQRCLGDQKHCCIRSLQTWVRIQLNCSLSLRLQASRFILFSVFWFQCSHPYKVGGICPCFPHQELQSNKM